MGGEKTHMKKGKKVNREWVYGNKMDGYSITKKGEGKKVVWAAQKWKNGKVLRGSWAFPSRAEALDGIQIQRRK